MLHINWTIILALTLSTSLAFNPFSRKLLPTQNGAMCMDGSPYGIYVHQPQGTPANKLLIFWQDIPDAWCIRSNTSDSINQCLKIIQTENTKQFGSSKEWEISTFYLNGVLSNGGYFGDWPKVMFKNCDGGSFLGNSDPITYKGKKLYFRGSQNVKEAVRYLKENKLLENKEQIVMMGTYAGAVSALLWSDYIKKQANTEVKIVADAALFLNVMDTKHNKPEIENRMKQIQKLTLQKTDLPLEACAKANSPDLWKCLFAEEAIKYVTVPVYFLQSFYDGFAIKNNLGIPCAERFGSLTECSKQNKKTIEDYHKNVSTVLQEITKNQKNSAMAISCVCHSFLAKKWDSESYAVPEGSGHTTINVVTNWVQGKGRELYLDAVDWPKNSACAHVLAPGPEQISKYLRRQ